MSSSDLISLFVAPLNRLGVTYMVTGAVAAIIYGEPRLTNDIDLVIDIGTRDVSRLRSAFDTSEFYVPPAEAIEIELRRSQHGHFNIIHRATALKADFYPAAEDRLHRWALPLRRRIAIEGEEMPVAPPEYVILRKLEYLRAGGSDKHVRDVNAMLSASGTALDRARLLDEVERLGLQREWQRVTTMTPDGQAP